MFAKIKVLLAALSFAGVAAKFSGFLGPVGAIIGAVVTFGLQIIKWFFEGVTVIVSHPVTLVTVTVVAVSTFAGGVKLGKEWDQYLVDRKEAVIQQMIADGNKANAAKKADLETAVGEAKKKEAAALAEPGVTVIDKPVPAKRVSKPTPRESSNQIGGPSLQWFQNVFGTNFKN